jgi:small subunit ribosomal protein S13
VKDINNVEIKFNLPVVYLKYDKNFINNYSSINTFVKTIYGFNSAYKKYIMQRYELAYGDYYFESFEDNLVILKILRTFFSRNFNIKKNIELNLLTLYNINCYRAWRHIRGLPTRGQRTWTNANSCFLSNIFLRKSLYNIAKLKYTGVQSSIANIANLAEYSNIVWKKQWLSEWNFMKNKRLTFKGAYSVYKIDLYAMSKFRIKVEKEQKVLSKRARRKKKKLEVKNIFTTGFEIGFTKSLLKKSNVALRTNKIQLITGKIVEKHKRVVKKKIDITKRKKIEKKKKKSVWD